RHPGKKRVSMRVSLARYPQMPLTDTRIRNTKSIAKPRKLTDAKGLYLEVRPTGAKLWRYRYRIAGKDKVTGKEKLKENVFAAGEYVQAPYGETAERAAARVRAGQLTLDEARAKRAEWRGLVKRGIHPSHQRQTEVAETIAAGANTFELIAA